MRNIYNALIKSYEQSKEHRFLPEKAFIIKININYSNNKKMIKPVNEDDIFNIDYLEAIKETAIYALESIYNACFVFHYAGTIIVVIKPSKEINHYLKGKKSRIESTVASKVACYFNFVTGFGFSKMEKAVIREGYLPNEISHVNCLAIQIPQDQIKTYINNFYGINKSNSISKIYHKLTMFDTNDRIKLDDKIRIINGIGYDMDLLEDFVIYGGMYIRKTDGEYINRSHSEMNNETIGDLIEEAINDTQS